MKISIEKLTEELIEECTPIIDRNYKETGHFIEDLDISWDHFLMLGDSFVCIIMRNDENKIVGILFFIISLYSHISYLLMAQQITFYVDKKYRFSSMRMLDFSEEFCKNNRVDFILQSARYGTKFCDTLKHKGYEPSDITFIKRMS